MFHFHTSVSESERKEKKRPLSFLEVTLLLLHIGLEKVLRKSLQRLEFNDESQNLMQKFRENGVFPLKQNNNKLIRIHMTSDEFCDENKSTLSVF